jgi:hypothetical protein
MLYNSANPANQIIKHINKINKTAIKLLYNVNGLLNAECTGRYVWRRTDASCIYWW